MRLHGGLFLFVCDLNDPTIEFAQLSNGIVAVAAQPAFVHEKHVVIKRHYLKIIVKIRDLEQLALRLIFNECAV